MPGLNGAAFHDFRSTDDIMSAFGDIFGGGLFGDLFGERRRGPRPGPDLLMKLEIELVEAARGTTRSIDVSRQDYCGECRGSGARKGTVATTCNYCGGRGQIVQARGFLPGRDHLPRLRRRRRADHRPLPQLPRQRARSRARPTFRSTSRPGVESGMWLQLRNQGELGDVGAPRGHLRIQILVKKHPFFERQRNDLVCQVPISFPQAALGAMIEVPTLDGRDQLEVPEGTQSGDVLRIKGRGMPDIGGRAGATSWSRSCRDPAASDAAPGRAAPRVRRDRARAGQPAAQELLRETARLLHRGGRAGRLERGVMRSWRPADRDRRRSRARRVQEPGV